MARFCKLSLLFISLLLTSTAYAAPGLFQITSLQPASPQPANVPNIDQANGIGASFYMRQGRKVTIEMTWNISEPATEEFTQWYFNDQRINFSGGRVESVILNGQSYTRLYSANFPEIYLDTQGGETELLTILNIQANKEGNYRVDIVQDNSVFTSATSLVKLVESCPQAPVDICFVIDGSGSLGQTGYDEERNFVVSIVNELTSSSNRYCYTIFDSGIESTLDLTGDRDVFSSTLLAERFFSGGTNLLTAIRHAATNLLTADNALDNRRRILFFLTDGGDSSSPEVLRTYSQILQANNVEVISIGFGSNVNEVQVDAIGITDSFVFTTFDEASLMIGSITSSFCPPQECCKGSSGYRGNVGSKGYSGDRGDDGVPGICNTLADCLGQGGSSKGALGVDGPDGQPGSKGFKGVTGQKGFQGSRGRKGNFGIQGLPGDNGAKGGTGTNGTPGPDGRKGNAGSIGTQGNQGQKGMKGVKGDGGGIGICRSDACKGEQGNPGPSGSNGVKGFRGGNGERGQFGAKGRKGVKGGIGSDGEPGAKGEIGPRGDAIEQKVIVDGACSPDGSIFLDPETRGLYYCEKGRYVCISSNDSCDLPTVRPASCTCVTADGAVNCGGFRESAASQACGKNVAVDFIFVVDDTSSMDRQQEWLRTNVPELETALNDLCIGNATGYPNRFQIVAYGGAVNIGPFERDGIRFANARDPHFVVPGGISFPYQLAYPDYPLANPSFTIDQLQGATANLQNIKNGFTGQNEVAYAAIQYALDNAVLRTNTPDATFIPVLLLLTNGDADDYTDQFYSSLLSQFISRPDMVLAFAINFGRLTTSDSSVTQPFGVANNYEGERLTAWVNGVQATSTSINYGVATTDVSNAVTTNPEFRNVNRDFIDLLLCSERSSASFWDLDFVVNGGAAEVQRFTSAFIQQNSGAIVDRAQSFTCRLCYCTADANEVCVIVQNRDICECLQGDNPPSQCSCVVASLQNIASSSTENTNLAASDANSIITDCGLAVTTTPSSANCKNYINSIN